MKILYKSHMTLYVLNKTIVIDKDEKLVSEQDIKDFLLKGEIIKDVECQVREEIAKKYDITHPDKLLFEVMYYTSEDVKDYTTVSSRFGGRVFSPFAPIVKIAYYVKIVVASGTTQINKMKLKGKIIEGKYGMCDIDEKEYDKGF